MKKAILIPILFIGTLQLKAQQQAIFKPVYLPKTTYSDTRTMIMAMNMQATGQDINMGMTMNSVGTTETGAPDKNKNVPVKITSKTTDMKMTMNGNDMPETAIPAVVITVYGKYGADSKLAIDSVAGQKINDSLRISMIKVVEALQNNIQFPDHPVKVSESFTINAPFDMGAIIPLGKGNTILANMTYKLVSLTNDMANFEIFEKIDIDLSKAPPAQTGGMTVVMKGLGTGTMTYDIKKQCLLTMSSTIDMNYDMGFSGQLVKGKGTVTTKDSMVTIANQ